MKCPFVTPFTFEKLCLTGREYPFVVPFKGFALNGNGPEIIDGRSPENTYNSHLDTLDKENGVGRTLYN